MLEDTNVSLQTQVNSPWPTDHTQWPKLSVFLGLDGVLPGVLGTKADIKARLAVLCQYSAGHTKQIKKILKVKKPN
jgi:hypothetical protein